VFYCCEQLGQEEEKRQEGEEGGKVGEGSKTDTVGCIFEDAQEDMQGC
jgi:hypothetical protein